VKTHLAMFAAACVALVPANIAVAKTTRLQTVNITDRHMSLEGGEARLYRINDARRNYCRIELIHLGETGRWIYVFDFGPKLFAAERTAYSYNAYFTDPVRNETVTERTTLQSTEGRAKLSKDFEEAKTFFDPLRLAKCSRR
jgi:hypothetical protein